MPGRFSHVEPRVAEPGRPRRSLGSAPEAWRAPAAVARPSAPARAPRPPPTHLRPPAGLSARARPPPRPSSGRPQRPRRVVWTLTRWGKVPAARSHGEQPRSPVRFWAACQVEMRARASARLSSGRAQWARLVGWTLMCWGMVPAALSHGELQRSPVRFCAACRVEVRARVPVATISTTHGAPPSHAPTARDPQHPDACTPRAI